MLTTIRCTFPAVIRYSTMRIAILFVWLSLSMAAEARLPDLIPYRKGNLWGYCDSTKRILIEPQWDGVGWFKHDRAIVCKDDSCAVIDPSGKYMIRPMHGSIMICSSNRFVAEVEERKKWVLLNDSGKVISAFDAEFIIQEGDSVLNVVGRKNKALVCNLNGEQIFAREYLGWDYGFGDASKFGLYIVEDYADYKGNFRRWNPAAKFYVIDKYEKPLFPGKYEWIDVIGDSIFECKIGDSLCYYDFSGKLLQPSPVQCRLFQKREYSHPYPYPLPMEWTYVRDEDGLLEHVFLGYTDDRGTEYWED